MNFVVSMGNAQVTLSWSPVSGVTYALARALSAAGPFQTVAAGLTATAYTDTGLTDGTTYYYYVVTADSYGTSAPSYVAQATPHAHSSPAPHQPLDSGSVYSSSSRELSLIDKRCFGRVS